MWPLAENQRTAGIWLATPSGSLRLAHERVEAAHGPGVAVVEVVHQVHHLVVVEDALAALAIDRRA